MTTVYLIRHAEAEGNVYRRCQGHYDSTITARGYRQIAALAKRFAQERIDAAYASDLTRTQTTALAVTRVHGLPLHTTPDLREVGVGEWEDRTWTYLTRFDHDRLLAFNTDVAHWHVAGGEDMERVRERMLRAVGDIVAAHPNGTVAVFSHGMALRTLIGTLQGLSFAEIDKTRHAENTAVTKLEADETGIRVVWRDDASHLPDELTTLGKQTWVKNKDGMEPGVWLRSDPEAAGRFEVMRDDESAGALSVGKGDGGLAVLDEFWLEDGARGHGFGAYLIGQAVSHARALGCDMLCARIPRDNAAGIALALKYGFSPARATPEAIEYRLYIGKDTVYREARFDEAWAEMQKSDG